MDRGLPATCLSLLRQFDATDANGSQGRRQIKRAWVVMNSKGTCSPNVVSKRPMGPEYKTGQPLHL